MQLFYIDESGEAPLDTGPQHYLLGGVVVGDTAWRALDTDVHALLDEYRPKCKEEVFASIKSDNGRAAEWWIRRALQRKRLKWTDLKSADREKVLKYATNLLRDEFEIHAVDIYHGHGVFEGVGRDLRMRLFGDAVKVVAKHKPQIICVVLDKAAHKQQYANPYAADGWSFTVLSDAFDEYLRKDRDNEPGMFIADTGGTDAASARRNLKRFQSKGTPFYNNKCERVIESIHFVPSHTSTGVQCADLVTYLIRHAAERSEVTKPLRQILGKACGCIIKRRPGGTRK